ncbi:DUF6716 putative glycosyltransferase [Planomonospora sp. ID67723]|uniref:DUF6716 putative glycosyltransferase n=1 Tax=Planomonospora sp. ID67723 TaxID=2738134 RepID=UPI0027DE0777|nr:DUF6716 putative glycosyltransferase [Planomonospora sp. ID67723]
MADSDSYLKWAACLLGDLPPGCTAELTVIRTPITPSPAQIHAAVAGAPRPRPATAGTAGPAPGEAGEPPVLSARALRRAAERLRPDVVLLACTGPVVDILAGEVLAGLSPRPVFVSGLPGISIPATEKAWLFRSGCDLFVLHSGREVEEFSEVGRRLGGGGQVGLARLPFLHGDGRAGGHGGGHGAAPGGRTPGTGPRNRVVFATQAKVPRRREERERILASLAELAGHRPDLDVVVKLRALDGERQTHNERHHYQRLWQELGGPEDTLRFAAGPMREHLERAAGFVTVSSTAALEAIAQSVPLLVLSDFGVNAEMINLVFEGSGVLGTLDDLSHGRFLTPDADWCRANYFHDSSESDWSSRLVALVGQARSGRLAPARSLLDGPQHAAARRRARLRVEVPPNVLRAGYRAKRRMSRYLKTLG